MSGPARTGSVEAFTRADGKTYFRGRIRLADSSRKWIDVPEKYSTPAGGKTARERAELYTAARQEREDETGELMAEKRARQTKRPASAGGQESASEWFERYTKLHAALGKGTHEHAGAWALYVEPIIGQKPLSALTPDDVKAIRDGLTKSRLDCKISAKRALNVWSTVVKAPLSRAFTDDDPKYSSVRVGPFSANPAAGIKPPVSNEDVEEDERERQVLEPSEAHALLSCDAIPLDTRRLYAWAMFTGLRPAELFGLDWGDVRELVIKVQRARDMKENSRDEMTSTKTKQGFRDLPIHPHLAPLVNAMRRTGRVFPLARARHSEQLVAELRVHLKLAGVTRPELHDGTPTLQPFDVRSFRTCFATWCARSGFDSAWIDAWLGHVPKTTAAKHYVKDTGSLTSGVFPTLPAELLGSVGPSVGPSGSQVAGTTVRRTGVELAQPVDLADNTSKLVSSESARVDASAQSAVDAGPTNGPTDALETALLLAAQAGRFDVVAQLAKDLEARRLASTPNVVPLRLRRDIRQRS